MSDIPKYKPKSEEDYATSTRRGQLKAQQTRASAYRIAKSPLPPLRGRS
jgi:hypothetical protein